MPVCSFTVPETTRVESKVSLRRWLRVFTTKAGFACPNRNAAMSQPQRCNECHTVRLTGQKSSEP